MKISVVMTTYNGAAFVERQLESLQKQTRPADELLIFDDCSADNTVEVCQRWLNAHPMPYARLIRNKKNKGWKKNFIEGMRQASGDLIFPCDQDDVWLPTKLEEMTARMENRPEILLLAHDYTEIYEAGSVANKHYNGAECRAAGEVVPYRYTKHFFMNPRPGCSYAVRRSFFEKVNDFWEKGFPHDEFLWIAALLGDGAYLYNKSLLHFYRYAGNNSDIRRKDIAMQLQNLAYIDRALAAFQALAQAGAVTVSAQKQADLAAARRWCAARKRIMETRNPLRWLALCPQWCYYNSPQNCLSDLYLVLFGSFARKSRS